MRGLISSLAVGPFRQELPFEQQVRRASLTLTLVASSVRQRCSLGLLR